MKPAALARPQLLALLQRIDQRLQSSRQSVGITVLGGAAILLQGFRERATFDLDIVTDRESPLFQKICRELSIPVDLVTISSTVDLERCSTINVFAGKSLRVESVTANDLIKLKLERFRKHDPEDIYAIISHTHLSFEDFATLIREMKVDYVGNLRGLLLSASVVVERMYAEFVSEFEQEFLR